MAWKATSVILLTIVGSAFGQDRPSQGEISGRVAYRDGTTPHESLVLELRPVGGQSSGSNEPFRRKLDITGPEGGFAFPALPSGKYSLWFHDFGTKHRAGNKDAIVLGRGSMEKRVHLEIPPVRKGSWSRIHYMDGLPHDIVSDITFDPQGRLWAGTLGGVARYDGDRLGAFGVADGLARDSTRALAFDDSGELYVGTQNGLSVWKNGVFESYQWQDPERPHLSFDISALEPIGEGACWLGTVHGHLLKLARGRLQPLTAGEAIDRLGRIYQIVQRPSGRLWIACEKGLFVLDPQAREWSTPFAEQRQALGQPVFDLAVADSGKLIVASVSGVWRTEENGLQRLALPPGLAVTNIESVDDVIWLGTEVGLIRYQSGTGVVWRQADSTPLAGHIKRLAVDDQGSLWVASHRGLLSYDPERFRIYDRRDGLAGDYVTQVERDREGALWMSSFTKTPSPTEPSRGRGLSVHESGGCYAVPIRGDKTDSHVWDLCFDADGDLWTATYSNLYEFDRPELLQAKRSDASNRGLLPSKRHLSGFVLRFKPDGHGGLWAAGERLWRIDNTGKVRVWQVPDVARKAPATDLLVRESDEIWLATARSGVLLFDGHKFERFDAEAGLPDSYVFSLAEKDRKSLWLGFWRVGLGIFVENRYQSAGVQGLRLPNRTILCLEKNSAGVTAIGTRGGMSLYDGQVSSVIDRRLGFKPNSVNDVLFDPTDPARLWLATSLGLIRWTRRPEPAPKPQITVLNAPSETDTDDPIRFDVETAVRLQCRVTDYANPGRNRRFRYRIRGVNNSDPGDEPQAWRWIDGDSAISWKPAVPGAYRCTVQYVDAGLAYSAPQSTLFRIVYPWYRHPGFLFPGIGVPALLLVLAAYTSWCSIQNRRRAAHFREKMLADEQRNRQALEEKTNELEALNTRYQKAKELAESANQAKTVFLANMSHEIRTPLNAILGYAQILQGSREHPRERLAAGVQTIQSSGEHLLSLLNGVLDLAKIESGKMEISLEAFDVRELCATIDAIFSGQCREKGLEWRTEIGVEDDSEAAPPGPDRDLEPLNQAAGAFTGWPTTCFRGDQVKLRQILINLLGNAVKFSDQGAVCFRVIWKGQSTDASQGNGERDRPSGRVDLRFEVADSGPGLDEGALGDRIAAFEQGPEGRGKGGTGLGLALVSRYLEMMSSRLETMRAPGGGAIMAFTIPFEVSTPQRRPDGVSAGAAPVRLSDGAVIQTLIVDDQKNNRDVLSIFLEEAGCEARQAASNREALEILQSYAPHIVFLDIRMPGESGLDLVPALRRRPDGGSLRIIAVTSSVVGASMEEMRASGFDGLIPKPFRYADLIQCLSDHLDIRENEASPFSEALPVDEKTLLSEPLDANTAEHCRDLLEAANSYNASAIRRILGELEKSGPLGAALSQRLSPMISRHALEELSRWLTDYLSRNRDTEDACD